MDAPLQADRRRDDRHSRDHHRRSRSPPRHHHHRDRRHGHPYDDRGHTHWDDRRGPPLQRHELAYQNHREPRPHERERQPRAPPPPPPPPSSYPEYYVKDQPSDENLPNQLQSDPRGDDPNKRITKKASHRGAGRNTESFDPASTLVRPDVRVLVGSPRSPKYNRVLKHDDVVIVPELFGEESDWSLYYKLVEEVTELQKDDVKGSEWISWHEGAQ